MAVPDGDERRGGLWKTIVVVVALSLFVVFLVRVFGSVGRPLVFSLSGLTAALAPTYDEEFVATVAARLLQVAVLYLAALVAAFRLLDSSEYLGAGAAAWSLGLVLGAQILVVAAAVVSTFVVVDPTGLGLLFAVAPMALAFLSSVGASIAGLTEAVSEENQAETQTPERRPTQVGIKTEAADIDEATQAAETEGSP
jgi:hypothetical protein